MKLRQYLLDHNLTLEKFGSSIGAKPETVRRWANGDRTPTPDFMTKIFETTGGLVAANDFYGTVLEDQKSGPESESLAS